MSVLVGEDDLWAGPTLVVAPHSDDEMIGCGGWLIQTLSRHVRRAVVYCAERGDTRRREAESACEGLRLSTFDLALSERGDWVGHPLEEAAARLAQVIEALEPAYVFAPAIGDPHPDHRATHALLSSALAASGGGVGPGAVVQYEGLVPLGDANWWLNISGVADEKYRRLAAYRSQEELYGLVETVTHLNRYRGRSLLRRAVTHAEAYTRMTTEDYLKRCRADRVS